MLGNLIGSFIVIVVGTSLAPTVAQNVGTAQADGNITGASDTLLGLTTLFYCLSIAKNKVATKKEISSIKPESRLKPLYNLINKGQDRSVKHLNYARTTDKGFFIFEYKGKNNIQSELVPYIKHKSNKMTSAMASAAIGKFYAHKLSNLFMRKPESRLKSKVLKYLDKTEASIQKPFFEYARTTDKGFQNGMIYSLVSCYN